jgi:hypothetical protein
LPHVDDGVWATIVASEVWKKKPDEDFDALEEMAGQVVRAMRAGRRHVPGAFMGEMMKEIYLGLAEDGYMEEFPGGRTRKVE